MKSKQVTISMPADIIEAIKEDIANGKLKGYRNHHQFCQEAVRLRYQQLINKGGSEEYAEKILEILKKISAEI